MQPTEAMTLKLVEMAPPPQPPLACPYCGVGVDVKRSRHVMVTGSAVRVFCSTECLESEAAGVTRLPTSEGDTDVIRPRPSKARIALRIIAAVLGLAAIAVIADLRPSRQSGPESAASVAPPVAVPAPPAVAEPAPAEVGPPWPPTDAEYLNELAQDAWIHPLAGPVRRMPKSDGRVFGAERPGERPVECQSGHCGVDIGGETWGEPIHAVHDGVVDRVVRGPNDDHGGLYVRISHRDGAIFSQYFHLAAIPRWITPGLHVKAGEVIGLLGDSGVFHSKPHLHFTLSVKAAKDVPERYIDPESLIAIWPLWVPDGQTPGALTVSTSEAPGVPLKSMKGGKKKNKKAPASIIEDAPMDTGEGAAPTSSVTVPVPKDLAPAP